MDWKRVLNRLTGTLFVAAFLCGWTAAGQAPAANEVWKDSATGLTWAVKDNGSNINQTQASEYCDNLDLGGFQDWRLPTIDELEGLYDSSVSKPYKAKGPIELSEPSIWSSTTNNSGEVWSFYFTYGGKSVSRGSGHGNPGRALCVRR